MKKWKALTVFGLVCALAAMPVLTFGASSKEESSGGSSRGGGSSSTSGSGFAGGGGFVLQKAAPGTGEAKGGQTTRGGTEVKKATGTPIPGPATGQKSAR